MTLPAVNNTTLTNLTGNLDIGDIADPALRLAAFNYIYTQMQAIVTELNSIPAGNLQNSAVIAAKIADLAVTTGKIADLAVTTAKLNDLSVTTTKLADLGVTAGKIALGAVGTSQIAAGSVTADRLDPTIQNSTNIEVVNARVSVPSNQTYATLKARLDNEIGILSKNAVSVLSYNAKADGVTDDTASINSAVSACSAAGGGIVFIPEGTYKFTSQIVIPAGVHLIGVGAAESDIGSQTIRPTRLLKSGAFDGIILNAAASMENINVDGDTGNTGFGVKLNGNRTRLENITVTKMGGNGVLVGDAVIDGNRNSWQLINVISRANGGNGFVIDDKDPGTGPDANAGYAESCSAYGNTGDGFIIDNAQVNTFVQCYAEGNTGLGWNVKANAQSNTFLNCGSEQNTAGNFTCAVGSKNNMIMGSLNYSVIDNGFNVIMKAAGGTSIQFLISQLLKVGIEGNRPTGIQKGIVIESNVPGVALYEADAPVNAKQWEWLSSGGTLILRTTDDSGNPASNVFYITRNGTLPAMVRVPTGILAADAGIGVGNSLAASTLGAVVKKMQVFDATGASLGYVPIYNSIT